MKTKQVWQKFYRNNQIKRLLSMASSRFFKKSYFPISGSIKKRLLSQDDTQEKIKEIIANGKPALIARFGSNEAICTAEGIGILQGAKDKFSDYVLLAINRNAGVFPYGEESALRFSEISAESAKQVDLLGVWATSMQDYLISEVCRKEMLLTKLSNLEPYYSENPWSEALEGKKVLVIHPFKESIESQFEKKELLFNNKKTLPDFKLSVMKSVQTIAGEKDDRFENWEQALEYMYKEAMTYDFDVAILGCGAYGMPLGAKLKQSGKIAIHLGGATQILFGIKGSRWDNHPVISKLFNEHWVRPLESETPTKAKNVENGCYW